MFGCTVPDRRSPWPRFHASRRTSSLPLLPLRDVVVFPHMVIPLFVGRPKSIKALDVAMDAGKNILLVAQKSAAKDDPGAEDLYDIGSIATVLQMLKLPDGTVKVLVEGAQRARVGRCRRRGDYLVAEAEPLRRPRPAAPTRSRRCAARCSRSSTSTSSSTRRSRRRS